MTAMLDEQQCAVLGRLESLTGEIVAAKRDLPQTNHEERMNYDLLSRVYSELCSANHHLRDFYGAQNERSDKQYQSRIQTPEQAVKRI